MSDSESVQFKAAEEDEESESVNFYNVQDDAGDDDDDDDESIAFLEVGSENPSFRHQPGAWFFNRKASSRSVTPGSVTGTVQRAEAPQLSPRELSQNRQESVGSSSSNNATPNVGAAAAAARQSPLPPRPITPPITTGDRAIGQQNSSTKPAPSIAERPNVVKAAPPPPAAVALPQQSSDPQLDSNLDPTPTKPKKSVVANRLAEKPIVAERAKSKRPVASAAKRDTHTEVRPTKPAGHSNPPQSLADTVRPTSPKVEHRRTPSSHAAGKLVPPKGDSTAPAQHRRTPSAQLPQLKLPASGPPTENQHQTKPATTSSSPSTQEPPVAEVESDDASVTTQDVEAQRQVTSEYRRFRKEQEKSLAEVLHRLDSLRVSSSHGGPSVTPAFIPLRSHNKRYSEAVVNDPERRAAEARTHAASVAPTSQRGRVHTVESSKGKKRPTSAPKPPSERQPDDAPTRPATRPKWNAGSEAPSPSARAHYIDYGELGHFAAPKHPDDSPERRSPQRSAAKRSSDAPTYASKTSPQRPTARVDLAPRPTGLPAHQGPHVVPKHRRTPPKSHPDPRPAHPPGERPLSPPRGTDALRRTNHKPAIQRKMARSQTKAYVGVERVAGSSSTLEVALLEVAAHQGIAVPPEAFGLAEVDQLHYLKPWFYCNGVRLSDRAVEAFVVAVKRSWAEESGTCSKEQAQNMYPSPARSSSSCPKCHKPTRKSTTTVLREVFEMLDVRQRGYITIASLTDTLADLELARGRGAEPALEEQFAREVVVPALLSSRGFMEVDFSTMSQLVLRYVTQRQGARAQYTVPGVQGPQNGRGFLEAITVC